MAFNNRGNSKGLMEDYAGAIADLTRAVTLDTSYALGFSNRGRWKSLTGDIAGALADYNRSIRLDPASPDPTIIAVRSWASGAIMFTRRRIFRRQ